MDDPLFLGIDVGSTTAKIVVMERGGGVLFKQYERHYSEVRGTLLSMLRTVDARFSGKDWAAMFTGSGAIGLAEILGVPFVQELIASTRSIRTNIPQADVVIELGGEDAKLTFLCGGADQRMNESCAGGTGAFIDQMAAFIQTDAAGLDELAHKHRTIYPIASRCGVFAKTDILPLLNQGSSREDIAASIMQAVVHQTISGLARGRAIEGNVVFLGGPLTFLPSLRHSFIQTLKLTPAQIIVPENGEFFVALGAALHAHFCARGTRQPVRLPELLARLEAADQAQTAHRLPPLFHDRSEQETFMRRHAGTRAEYASLEDAKGPAWLGFDSGSTTMKAVLIDAKGRILYSFYGPNQGDPLAVALDVLKDIYARKHESLTIRHTAATGYGSGLLCAALGVDIDEVETVAHMHAARFFNPHVSYILDIGGQDIKCLSVRDGVIDQIQLNEACSAGCGSFIENFAVSLGLSLERFVELALSAPAPVDLGTRCTVFMNSKVKQMQKEGASIADIAAGLCYAVIRNACYKVMKIKNVAELGASVVAQGGSFLNNALLRALELELGKPVTRPPIAGLMGALGAALIAQERSEAWAAASPATFPFVREPAPVEEAAAAMPSTLLGPFAVAAFSARKSTVRCKHCGNHCLLTIIHFGDKRRYIAGNRCEKGAEIPAHSVPNLYTYKYQRLFSCYSPLSKEQAWRGTLGLPRALNIYENYPLWFTLFTRLGYRVEVSAPSSRELFFSGYETIPSQTVCYPAKLAHGHVLDLVEKGVDAIFFPCIPFEHKDFATQDNNYNCPVVTGYPELLANNIHSIKERGIPFIHEFLPLAKEMLSKRLGAIPFFSSIPPKEMEEAVQLAFNEWDAYKTDIRNAGEETLELLRKQGGFGIILAGHPYHADPGVHHGIAELITSYGAAVLTEDSVAHLMPDAGLLRVVDQWTYHARQYRAAAYAASTDNLAVLQIVSFGCGLDAITSDQLHEIVADKGRLYAQIKVDEGDNLGPARIRIRSLLAALHESCSRKPAHTPSYRGTAVFTQSMRETHTILIPQLSPLHFQFIESVFAADGYITKQLPQVDREAIDLGLRHVNNDACYPAIVTIGQLLQAIQSKEYDPQRVALMISETGGGCRATNYIALLRKALADCGLDHIPIISFAVTAGQEKSGFSLSGKVLRRSCMAGVYGDALMQVLHRVRPYELHPGSAVGLMEEWAEKGKQCIASGNIIRFEWMLFSMIRAFDSLPLRTEKRKPCVGLVGEILLKYHPDANNEAAKVIEQHGGEAVVSNLMDFVLYCLYDNIFNYKHLSGSWRGYINSVFSIRFIEFARWSMRLYLRSSKRFSAPPRFQDLQKKVRGLISLGHQTGEGWLLTAEMVALLESGVSNILCMQPFGCLPNHITGKGVLKELKKRFPDANVVAVDYDPGASESNQINRIKLMMAMAAEGEEHKGAENLA